MCKSVANPYCTTRPGWRPEVNAAFEADDIGHLHGSIDAYAPTPLISLPTLADDLEVGRIMVKDEAHRFGLKAFKALGATYAIYRYLRRHLRETGRSCPPPTRFYSDRPALRDGEITFCTATDGNHGRGVAWTSRLLGQKAVIYMPADSVPARIESIRGEGAEVVVIDGTYDECVRRSALDAKTNGWHIISDTSWPGYEDVPRWVMAGYLTLFREIEASLAPSERLDLVIVQGGVGSLAAAAAWYFRKLWTRAQPRLLIVEPAEAACLMESICSPDGEPVLSAGRQDSIMAGLNCGYPSPVAWPLIKLGFDAFVSVADDAAVKAMRAYYHSRPGDPSIVSGESGAAGLAALTTLRHDRSLVEARSALGPGRRSTVLLLNTEGDTDPDNYRRLVLDRSS